MGRIITLTTDFGYSDEYVGVMKGVILARAPAATIVDLCHAVVRQDIVQAALLLNASYGFFPPGTIHVVVVDPGVGSKRRLILVLADGQLFLAPDNGVLSLLLDSASVQAAYEIECHQYYLSPVSTTFHGRDILAPVAAHLAAGLDPADTGPQIEPRTLQRVAIAEPFVDTTQKKITGKILSHDHFGNLQTNIREKSLEALWGRKERDVKVIVKGVEIFGIQDSYMAAGPGNPVLIINSRGFLEVAVNGGNGAAFLEAGPGDTVVLEKVIKRQEELT